MNSLPNDSSRLLSKATRVIVGLVLGSALLRAHGADGPGLNAQSSSAAPGENALDAAIKGRKHPSYQVFAARVDLPAMRVVSTNCVLVSPKARICFAYPDGLEDSVMKQLSVDLRIPPAALGELHRVLSAKLLQAPASLLEEFRTAIIDYRYLVEKWNQFIPQDSAAVKIKQNAIDCLQAGRLNQAWELYRALPKPGAPGERQLTSQPRP